MQVKTNQSKNELGNNWQHLQNISAAEDEITNESIDTTQVIDQEEKLQKLVDGTHQFCFKIQTHAPIDIFPDEIIIDIHKVSFIYKSLMSKDVLSIPIKDINKVEVANDLLSAHIEIVNGSQTTTLTANWLKKSEAREAQAILQGLMIAYKNNIDISQFDTSEITDRLITLGNPIA